MRDFIIKILSFRGSFTPVSISSKNSSKVEEAAIKSLNLANISELRDLFEGVAFLEKFSLKVYGILALENLLKEEILDWKEMDPKLFEPTISIFGKVINVVTFNYGEFPIISKTSDTPTIFIIKKDKKDVWICGFADVDVLNSFQDDTFLKGSMTKDIGLKTAFVGFEKLQPINNLDQLKSFLK